MQSNEVRWRFRVEVTIGADIEVVNHGNREEALKEAFRHCRTIGDVMNTQIVEEEVMEDE